MTNLAKVARRLGPKNLTTDGGPGFHEPPPRLVAFGAFVSSPFSTAPAIGVKSDACGIAKVWTLCLARIASTLLTFRLTARLTACCDPARAL